MNPPTSGQNVRFIFSLFDLENKDVKNLIFFFFFLSVFDEYSFEFDDGEVSKSAKIKIDHSFNSSHPPTHH